MTEHTLLNAPPSPAPSPDGARDLAEPDLSGWLGGLLDMARDRGDAPLCRLIAGVADDLRAARGISK